MKKHTQTVPTVSQAPFGDAALLEKARSLFACLQILAPGTHAANLSARAGDVVTALETLQATGNYLWPAHAASVPAEPSES